MTDLINFLLDNLFIVIIAIGFLLSLFRSAGKANRMPDFGGGGKNADGNAGRRSAGSAGQQPNTAASESSVRYPIRYDQMPVSELSVQSTESAARERRHRELMERKPGQMNPSGRIGKGLAEPGVQEAGAEEMRRAVIWAEILGPPRAKRPYR